MKRIIFGLSMMIFMIVFLTSCGGSGSNDSGENDSGTPPAGPTNLAAVNIYSNRIELSWNCDADNEIGFIVERSNDGISFSETGTTSADILSYTDANLTSETTYYYRITAYNNFGNSDPSDTMEVTTLPDNSNGMLPEAPTDLLSNAITSNQITLSWNDNSDNESGFILERSQDGSSFSEIHSISENTTSYADSGLTEETTYYYRMRAFNASGNSDYSNTLQVTTTSYIEPDATILVGPSREYKTPSEAAAIAQDGDVIEIDAGLYQGDIATWNADNLIIRGAGAGAHLDAEGVTISNQKAIWVIRGDNTTVENIEFSGAAVPDRNGAGIRQEGVSLTVRNCYFHHNEMGILAGDKPESEILVEYSEFHHHGKTNGGFSHNIYINHVEKFIFRYNYSHHAEHGHTVKSRAHENHILYNRIMDEADGYGSYLIDLPNGGRSYIIGNIVHQGANGENTIMITFAEEGAINPLQELYVINNTFVNDRNNGRGIRIVGTPSHVKIINNIFDGFSSMVLGGTGEITNNFESSTTDFVARDNYDYRLNSGDAIDSGVDSGTVNGVNLTPEWEYQHPTSGKPRSVSGQIDIGAFEN